MTLFAKTIQNFRRRRGSASALIVLLLVLMVFFGVLSIVTAAADNRLADRRAEWVQAYYQADQTAVRLMAELRLAADAAPEFTDAGAMYALFEQKLNERPGVELLDSGTAGRQVSLLLRIHEGDQAIEAGAVFALPDQADGPVLLTVTRWTAWQQPFDYDQTGGGIWKG